MSLDAHNDSVSATAVRGSRLLTEQQAAVLAQVNKKTIRRLIETGRLRAADFGSGRHCYRIDPSDLQSIASVLKHSKPMLQKPKRLRRRRACPQNSVVAYLPSI